MFRSVNTPQCSKWVGGGGEPERGPTVPIMGQGRRRRVDRINHMTKNTTFPQHSDSGGKIHRSIRSKLPSRPYPACLLFSEVRVSYSLNHLPNVPFPFHQVPTTS